MAAAARRITFDTATYGSLAHELDYVESFGDEYAEAQPRQKERERAVPKAAARAHAQPVGVSLFAVVGVLLAAALMVCVLLSYVQLAEISGDMTALQKQMTELKKEEARLTIEYEKAFNLSAVEDYAVNTLGMTKLTESQIYTVDIQRHDKAEVLGQPGAKGTDFFSGAAEYITSLLAYFK